MEHLCIYSHDRILSLLVSRILRSQFSVTIAHDHDWLASWLEDEKPALIVCDTASFDASAFNALYTRRAKHHGLPCVLLFVSLAGLHSLDPGFRLCVDKVLPNPLLSEEIVRTVMEMTDTG